MSTEAIHWITVQEENKRTSKHGPAFQNLVSYPKSKPKTELLVCDR